MPSVLIQIYDKEGEEIIKTIKDINLAEVPDVVSKKVKEIFNQYDYSDGFTVQIFMAK